MLLRFLSLSSFNPFCTVRVEGTGSSGDKVPWRSSRSRLPDAWSPENGNQPKASLIKEMPSDQSRQTSDLKVHCSLEYVQAIYHGQHAGIRPSPHEESTKGGNAHTRVNRGTAPPTFEVTNLDFPLEIEQDTRQLDICGM